LPSCQFVFFHFIVVVVVVAVVVVDGAEMRQREIHTLFTNLFCVHFIVKRGKRND